jgi:hypothetical protein
MNLPDGIGQREVLIGVGILVVIAIIAVPMVGYSQKKNRRAECEQLVESIRDAQIKHGKAFPGEGYVSAKWAPRDPTVLNGEAIEWTPSAGFTALGWNPKADDFEWIRGTYRVAATSKSFKVIGRCDIDGDGIPAEFVADQDTPVAQTTAADIY